jgi:hypothetical protein
MVAKNGAISTFSKAVLTPLASAVKIADRRRHLVAEPCKLRGSEIMLLSKLDTRGFVSLRQRIQSGK